MPISKAEVSVVMTTTEATEAVKDWVLRNKKRCGIPRGKWKIAAVTWDNGQPLVKLESE